MALRLILLSRLPGVLLHRTVAVFLPLLGVAGVMRALLPVSMARIVLAMLT
jgi:hypothetical protein